jgi:hypothetical protein
MSKKSRKQNDKLKIKRSIYNQLAPDILGISHCYQTVHRDLPIFILGPISQGGKVMITESKWSTSRSSAIIDRYYKISIKTGIEVELISHTVLSQGFDKSISQGWPLAFKGQICRSLLLRI